jgi:hypothetical protein
MSDHGFELGTARPFDAITGTPAIVTGSLRTGSYALDLSGDHWTCPAIGGGEEFTYGPWRLRMTTEAGRRQFTVWHDGVEVINVEGARDTVLTFLPAAIEATT